ncbi:nitroreductase family deazaflavin-dependent oxidoreductase [Pseudonocardia sp. RS11V-5]|uniref:nitroreductase family deazaflavin-dependent oxidoreductase n=1 Tax=Pseudonocardia terrae TaxID=2905831 RepID=UPI001E5B9F17|nr:nitroreductase family deazaflavin-dependent oxidoreductase [Pseudonocardia terrae]MCE3556036.1 nitroreductase family deazaflavin-dependent oxidoreductase [Pseudonocardia terrae]
MQPDAGGDPLNARPARVPSRVRLVLGLPRHLYAHGLGGLLGSRFLQLTHTGRRSGRRYDTVLEVVHHDRASGEYVVVAGLGREADWYRNVRAGGPLAVTVGRRRFPAQARELDTDEAVAVLRGYEHRNRLVAPVIHRVLSGLLGWTYRGTSDQRRRLAHELPLVGLRPH